MGPMELGSPVSCRIAKPNLHTVLHYLADKIMQCLCWN
jgi:hypothetical protein